MSRVYSKNEMGVVSEDNRTHLFFADDEVIDISPKGSRLTIKLKHIIDWEKTKKKGMVKRVCKPGQIIFYDVKDYREDTNNVEINPWSPEIFAISYVETRGLLDFRIELTNGLAVYFKCKDLKFTLED